MIYFLALLPATLLTVAGSFVLVLSTRAEGGLRTFGRYLGFWAFTLAGLVILGAIFAAAHGGHREFAMRAMHEGTYCPWREDHWGSRPAEPPRDSGAQPAPQSPPPPPKPAQ